jgi:amino acid adenylation domain-containing protein/thioester reductase-like protein
MTTFSVILIGRGNLLTQCAGILNSRAHRIKAIFSPDDSVRSWAHKSGVEHYQTGEATSLAPQLEFDLLLSIGNYTVIPDAVVNRAKRMGINYHYGPLPEYSGLHVPSWAIFERATDHAIAWHRIGGPVDGGNILKQVRVPIDASDTALSLLLKCDAAALGSFAGLISEFEEGRVTETPQDLGKRRYFSRLSQFPLEGVIDWTADAEQIGAMVRAADYGPFNNPLVWPKVRINGQFFAVRQASIGAARSTSKPGTIIAADGPAALHVATGKGSIFLETLSSLEGEALSVREIADANDLRPDVQLTSPIESVRPQITEAALAASKTTPYWSERLRNYEPYRLPYTVPEFSAGEDASPVIERLGTLPESVRNDDSFLEYLVGALCTFLARASGVGEVHLAIAAPRDVIPADYRELFCAWVPLAAHVEPRATLDQNLKTIAAELRSVRAHGVFRRDLIGRDPDLSARFQRGELCADVMISWDARAAGHRSIAQRPALEIVLHPATGVIEFHFDPKKISRKNTARLASQLAEWCAETPSRGAQPLQSVPAVSRQEHAVLIDGFNNTQDGAILGRCLPRLFEDTARKHGEKVALVCGSLELSYAQLNADANRLARLLRRRGVRCGQFVGVCLDRSLDLVVALLAVLKAGAAYIPVDLNFPKDRIRRMIEVAEPRLLITPAGFLHPSLQTWSDRCLGLDAIRLKAADCIAGNLKAAPAGEDLAYVIFTSGSTGKPKGVEVTHRALGNFLLSMRSRPGCTASDRLLALTTISFDIAVLELFLPLICGATVIIAQANENVDGDALLALMKRHQVTMLQATPTTWQLLLQSGWQGQPSLSKILCGGEAMPRSLADRLLSCGETVWNMYGPTETTVWSSTCQISAGGDIAIGTPIANTQLYVLDDDLLPVPVGFPGELCIGGSGVARSYHKDPEQTKLKFVPNPFHPGTLYRTGDIACFKEPGVLVVLGRKDQQIKLRGFRVELGDIERAISSHPAISQAVVTGRGDRLVAYCLRSAAAPADTVPGPADDTVCVEWAGVWDHAYEGNANDPSFNISGWHNSYDGQMFSQEEMRDWQSCTVNRVLSYSPKHVLEIGCGTGLVLFAVAPHCSSYRAVDASKQAVDIIRRNLADLPQVTCEHCPAHKLAELAVGGVDTIIINSVVQYFPGESYLTSILEWASQVLVEGRIFIGDVRDLSLLNVFHADIIQYKSEPGRSDDESRRRAERSRHLERELAIAPEFFAELPSVLPRIRRVEIALRDGNYVNEMTRYRYDVTLHVGEVASCSGNIIEDTDLDWREERLDLLELRRRLDRMADKQVRLLNVPNGRLSGVYKRVAPLLDCDVTIASRDWVDLRELGSVAHESGYEAKFQPSRSRDIWAFDAVLWRPGEKPNLEWLPPDSTARIDLARYANVPANGESQIDLGRLLRPWLGDRLPNYLMPDFFVELEEFPLTPNGKIDRKALPEPMPIAATPAALPEDELQRQILSIWSDVLGHDRIGIDDSFFIIGGNSLRVVRVQARLQELLGRPVPIAKLYECFTIRTLSAHLSGNKKTPARSLARRPLRQTDEAVAIVSMACRLPGNIHTPEEFWQLLKRGGDGIIDVPADRWDGEALFDPDPDVLGKSYSSKGGFVVPVDQFDASFFGIAPREAHALDPAQRMILEVTWEAFERAGCSTEQLRGSETGVFIGIGRFYDEYGVARGDLDDLDGYVGTGSAGSTMSGRVSYVFGLEGPAMTVDTGCSSSLVTTHLACTALRQGECDLAVSAGVTLLLRPDLHVEFSRLRGMSPEGRCKPFSSSADGTIWSEGAAVIVLKRLSDAQRDGDPILAVLRGTAVNHAGHSASLTTPSGPAQQRVIRKALAVSSLAPGDIDYLEAHGTGTTLGDPIEATALAAVFEGTHSQDRPLWVGSVKSNLGHTQAAAGLAGVIKTVLAMQNNELPRTLHANEPSPTIDWNAAQMALVREQQPWPRRDRPRRAGISSFGIGGTNAHVIVEEAPVASQPKPQVPVSPVSSLPFVLSASSTSGLRAQARKLYAHLENTDDRLVDVAHSLATARTHLRKRQVLFADDKTALLKSLASCARGENPAGAVRTPETGAEGCRVALLFTGQGSQLPGMGRKLYDLYPVFKNALDEIAAQFTALEHPLLDVMWAEPGSAKAALLHRTDFTQPALFAIEVALWRLWESWGVKPDLLLGHSIGELAAAHVAGIFDLDNACRLVAARGSLMRALPSGGAMASIEASGEEVGAALASSRLTNNVSIAGLNSPQQTVVSGDAAGVARLLRYFARQKRKAKTLQVSHAFHSHLMDGMLAEFGAVADTIVYAPPKLPLVSSLTGELVKTSDITRSEYWVRQARETVRFNAGMRSLYTQGANAFLELGPQPVLSGMGAACLADDGPVSWLASLSFGKDDVAVMQKSLAQLHVLGVPVNWRGFFAPLGGERVALPTYAFQRERYWLEPRQKQAVAAGLTDTRHRLLGSRIQIASNNATMFTALVAGDQPNWLNEHQMNGAVLMPGTGFIEAMRAAAKVSDKGVLDLCDLVILAPLVLPGGTAVCIQVTLDALSEGAFAVRVYSSSQSDGEDGDWQLHAEAKLVPARMTKGASAILPPPGAEIIDVTAFYDELSELGYGYGPCFRGLAAAWQHNDEVWAKALLPESAVPSASEYGIHPGLLDSALHALLLTLRLKHQDSDDAYMPFEAERLSFWRDGLGELWVRVTDFEKGDDEFWASVDFYDAEGNYVGRLDRLHARRIDRAALRQLTSAGVDRFQFKVAWHAVEAGRAPISGTWGLLCMGDVPWVEDVRTSLASAGVAIVDIAQLSEAEWLDGIICVWSSGDDVIGGANALAGLALEQLQSLVLAEFKRPVVWVTRRAVGTDNQDLVAGLGASPLWGLMRSARNEHPGLAVRSVDIGDERADVDALASALGCDDEPECALRRGAISAPRLERAAAAADLVFPADGSWRLELAASRQPDQPFAVKSITNNAPAAGEVRASVMAAGINFLDVLSALGMMKDPALGLEFAGVVTGVGSGVHHIRPGDRVMGWTGGGSFASEVITDERHVVPIPGTLGFEEAATIPMAFLTAWYGLHVLGAMKPGEKVLIHAAAGGVGMAAVQLAQLVGAEVYGTASPAKWPALRQLGLDDDHIASSRSHDFAGSFRNAASDKDFDIVLNSLTGEFVDAGLALLGKGGRFLELGKIDLREQSWIDQHHRGVTYRPYNLPDAGADLIREMLVSVATLFAEGKLKPLPLKTFPMKDAPDAMRWMAQAKHVGKVVLVPTRRDGLIRSDGAVLITGGVGGLGRYVAKWLATEHGVKDLVLTSRRGMNSPDAKAFVAELAELGAAVTVSACDAADARALSNLIEGITKQRPLRGVVHAAGVLDDGILTELTPARLGTVFSPKVDGAWHLHKLTQDLELDFFVLFSSISGVIGAPGQANYSAANTFLDALAHHRRAQGLPATSIAWGAWGEQGMAARLSEADRARANHRGMKTLAPDEGLQLLESALVAGAPSTIAAAFDLPKLRRALTQHEDVPALFRSLFASSPQARSPTARSATNLRKLLNETTPEQQEAVVLSAVRGQVAKVLEFGSPEDVDVDLPLQDIGVDSLTAVLLRNQLTEMTGLSLSAKIARDHPNLRALAQFLCTKIRESDSMGLADGKAAIAPDLDHAVRAAAGNSAMNGRLEAQLQFKNAETMERRPHAVFLTGATGFAGAFVLRELLNANVSVHCLIRADDVEQAATRVKQTLGDYGLLKPDVEDLVTPIVGDLGRPLFGMSEDDFDRLADQVDAICHLGAVVDWVLPLDEYLGPNVLGTHEVLRLASRGRGKAVHHVSTFATLPRYFGYESSPDSFGYGYTTSKWMSEQMVAAARWRGAQASIYRLPFATASSGTGHFRLDRGDFLHNLIAGSMQIGCFPSLDFDLRCILPIDYLAGVIGRLVTSDLEHLGKDYDFLNPKAPSFNRYVELVRSAGYQAETVPFEQWKTLALQHAKASRQSPLARIASLVDVLTPSILKFAFEGLSLNDNANVNAFGGEYYPCPPVDAKTVHRYLRRITETSPALDPKRTLAAQTA